MEKETLDSPTVGTAGNRTGSKRVPSSHSDRQPRADASSEGAHSAGVVLESRLRSGVRSTSEHYFFGRVLGQGAYSVVRAGVHTLTHTDVAIKTYRKSRLTDSRKRDTLAEEIRILQQIDHPNIVKFFEVIETDEEVHLVLELVQGVPLTAYLKQQPAQRLSEVEARNIFKQVVAAVTYCHSLNIAHRDLKLDNVLVQPNRAVKLIDFGFATVSTGPSRFFCGTPSYMAPEIVKRREHSPFAADAWALGVLLFTMINGTFPFKGSNDQDVFRRIGNGCYSHSQTLIIKVRQLIGRLLVLNPRQRLTAAQLQVEAWVQA